MMQFLFEKCSDYHINSSAAIKELREKNGLQIIYDAPLDAPELIPAGGAFDRRVSGWERNAADLEYSARQRGEPAPQMIHRLADDHMVNVPTPWGELVRVPASQCAEWAKSFEATL